MGHWPIIGYRWWNNNLKMAIITYNNVGITAMAACLPKQVIDNYQYDLDIWPEAEVRDRKSVV